MCGDDPDSKALALELAERLTTGRALDAGPLASARALEGLTAVIVNVNKRYKAHAGVRAHRPAVSREVRVLALDGDPASCAEGDDLAAPA